MKLQMSVLQDPRDQSHASEVLNSADNTFSTGNVPYYDAVDSIW